MKMECQRFFLVVFFTLCTFNLFQDVISAGEDKVKEAGSNLVTAGFEPTKSNVATIKQEHLASQSELQNMEAKIFDKEINKLKFPPYFTSTATREECENFKFQLEIKKKALKKARANLYNSLVESKLKNGNRLEFFNNWKRNVLIPKLFSALGKLIPKATLGSVKGNFIVKRSKRQEGLLRDAPKFFNDFSKILKEAIINGAHSEVNKELGNANVQMEISWKRNQNNGNIVITHSAIGYQSYLQSRIEEAKKSEGKEKKPLKDGQENETLRDIEENNEQLQKNEPLKASAPKPLIKYDAHYLLQSEILENVRSKINDVDKHIGEVLIYMYKKQEYQVHC